MRSEHVLAGKHDFSHFTYDAEELRAKDDDSVRQIFDELNSELSDAVTKLHRSQVEFNQASEIAAYWLRCVELIEAEMYRRKLIKPEQQK